MQETTHLNKSKKLDDLWDKIIDNIENPVSKSFFKMLAEPLTITSKEVIISFKRAFAFDMGKHYDKLDFLIISLCKILKGKPTIIFKSQEGYEKIIDYEYDELIDRAYKLVEQAKSDMEEARTNYFNKQGDKKICYKYVVSKDKYETRLNNAISLINTIIELNPDSKNAFNKIAFCHKDKDEYELATKKFINSLESILNIAEVYYGLALYFRGAYKRDKNEKLIKPLFMNYNKALSLFPESEKFNANCANDIEIIEKDFARAIDFYSKALSLCKNPNLYYYIRISYCHRKLNQISEAIDIYSKAIEQNICIGEATCRIANIYLEQKNTKKAEEFFNKAIKIEGATAFYQKAKDFNYRIENDAID